MITVILQARRRCCRNGLRLCTVQRAVLHAKELLEIVRHYSEDRRFRLDCVVQDWNTWDPGNWGEKILDQTRYGDMKE